LHCWKQTPSSNRTTHVCATLPPEFLFKEIWELNLNENLENVLLDAMQRIYLRFFTTGDEQKKYSKS